MDTTRQGTRDGFKRVSLIMRDEYHDALKALAWNDRDMMVNTLDNALHQAGFSEVGTKRIVRKWRKEKGDK